MWHHVEFLHPHLIATGLTARIIVAYNMYVPFVIWCLVAVILMCIMRIVWKWIAPPVYAPDAKMQVKYIDVYTRFLYIYSVEWMMMMLF